MQLGLSGAETFLRLSKVETDKQSVSLLIETARAGERLDVHRERDDKYMQAALSPGLLDNGSLLE